jgi:hypothetical protein
MTIYISHFPRWSTEAAWRGGGSPEEHPRAEPEHPRSGQGLRSRNSRVTPPQGFVPVRFHPNQRGP